jgi:hypothetical protein
MMKVYKVKKTRVTKEVRKVWATDAKSAEALANLGDAGWLIHRSETVDSVASDPEISWTDVDDFEISGIDPNDHPDHADAFLLWATHKTEDRKMTESELERLQQLPEFSKRLTEI